MQNPRLPGPSLEAVDLRRIVQERVILSSISFQVAAGEVLFVYGPPRAGKTELLRCLALLSPLQVHGVDDGDDGMATTDAQENSVFLPVTQRRVVPFASTGSLQKSLASQRGGHVLATYPTSHLPSTAPHPKPTLLPRCETHGIYGIALRGKWVQML